MRIAHVITRMILGGAQENTLLCCRDHVHRYKDDVLLVTGPAEGPEGSLLERAAREGVPTAILPDLVREIHPWHDVKAYFAVRSALAAFRPDVVHTHSAKAGVLGRMAAWSLGVPAIVHTVHGAPWYPAQNFVSQGLIRWAEWYAARHCHQLVSVADAMTEQMVAGGVAPREKFVTVWSGMEVEPFLAAEQHRARMREELGFAPEEIVIGKIGRLFELKGHDDVLSSFESLELAGLPVRLLLIGDGILRESLEQRVHERGLTGKVTFAGLVAPERIPEFLSAMDVVVHASLREGLARVLPQSLIAGKPVVTYDVDGAREVVTNGETGFLIPAGDVAGLTAALRQLVSDPALRVRLGQSHRHELAERFRYETMTDRLREIYTRLLAKQSS